MAHPGTTERTSQQAAQAREELRRAVGFSAADEIEKLDRLKKSGSITDQEFARLRAKLVA
jgi:Short C-terminal domain